jgi:hypothetical protein
MTFDDHVLDIIDMWVSDLSCYILLSLFRGLYNIIIPRGSRPVAIYQGATGMLLQ